NDKKAISYELGDLLWYLATSARYLGISLEQVASENIEKLESRLNRGKISGSGDER
ncbi:MAG: MazG nucleotide pyrophosphohydrolase domain-containing protein, partial [Lactococcus lactis]|nr:MazG nucleotide pyrophosphohydrolase domain-containing protein [Lactococcus lactis]